MTIEKSIIVQFENNFSTDKYLLGQTKALLIQSIFEIGPKNIFVFDGPDSLLLFIESVKICVSSQKQAFRFQFVVKAGGRSHDIAGDMMILEEDVLDYAIIIDANLDNSFLRYLNEKIERLFSKIEKAIISNFKPNKETPLICQQKYGYMCSIFAVDNVVHFSSYSVDDLFGLFWSISKTFDAKRHSVRVLHSLPVQFVRLAHRPEDFPEAKEALVSFPFSTELNKYYQGIKIEERFSYRDGIKKFNIGAELLRREYASCLIGHSDGFLYRITQDQYQNIIRTRFGFDFVRSYTPVLPISRALIFGEQKVIFRSSCSIQSYRIGDITAFYRYCEILERCAGSRTESETQDQLSKLRSNLFLIQEGPFLSNPLLKNSRAPVTLESGNPTAMELISSRKLMVQTAIPIPDTVAVHYDYDPPDRRPPFIGTRNHLTFFRTYAEVHSEYPVDPCPDSVTIEGNRTNIHGIFKNVCDQLHENPSFLEFHGGENTLFLLSLSAKIESEFSNEDSVGRAICRF